jgi:hypothetical protein
MVPLFRVAAAVTPTHAITTHTHDGATKQTPMYLGLTFSSVTVKVIVLASSSIAPFASFASRCNVSRVCSLAFANLTFSTAAIRRAVALQSSKRAEASRGLMSESDMTDCVGNAASG